MLKKFAVGSLTLAFLALGAGTCLAAPDPAQLNELKALNQQMFTLKKQMVDKQLEAGLLDQEKAAKIKTFIEARQKQIEEDFAKGQYSGFGKKHGHGFNKGCPRNAQDAPKASPSPSNI
ncbi:Protein of unknown function (DUF2680) [Desulfosporosinus acidiphilus SJ4]|uniref:DUF2680 domain-containing protein n=1 Tax=Desulfosporosinus acidiphilus (strain DSM 22704 / JCM 16185 / SJ4) TaxID=646529 RepID=I4D0L2_DESAJ|nr:DUF2680 domain-containing protein [Desulfosporosinus acidiphilus]AFM39336.1 Protein of unknown function (DUF2680) [Desulfosporosinus acidiphilus SJ4]